MFLLEFDTDEVKKEASKLLKSIGVKHRLKKFEVKGVSFSKSIWIITLNFQ